MGIFFSYIFLSFANDTHIIHLTFVVPFIFEHFVFQLASMGLVV
jgi:hypothetical protein